MPGGGLPAGGVGVDHWVGTAGSSAMNHNPCNGSVDGLAPRWGRGTHMASMPIPELASAPVPEPLAFEPSGAPRNK
jgi:hypothetical protein